MLRQRRMDFSLPQSAKTLKKTKSLTWDNSTWDAQILPSITKELESLDVHKHESSKHFSNAETAGSTSASLLNSENGILSSFTEVEEDFEEDDERSTPPFFLKSSSLERTQSVRSMIPPPGFEEIEAKREPLHSLNHVKKLDGLKRCVTFAGIIPKHYTNGGVDHINQIEIPPAEVEENSGKISTFFVRVTDHEVLPGKLKEQKSKLKRIDSAKMVRQAFPKTIFDNSDHGDNHDRDNGKYYSQFEQPLRKRRSESVSSLLSDESTNSTATSASNPVLVARGYTDTTSVVESFGASDMNDRFRGSQNQNGKDMRRIESRQWNEPVDTSYFNRQAFGNGMNSSSIGHPPNGYAQNLHGHYAPNPYTGLDQQQQIQLMQQQLLHNQMMFRWMMQQQNFPPMTRHGATMESMSFNSGWQPRTDTTSYSVQTDQTYGRKKKFNGVAPTDSYREQTKRSDTGKGPPINMGSKGTLLTKHKLNGYRPTFSELQGNVLEFSRDSHGSRFVQYMMETTTAENRQLLIDEVLPEAASLMQDLFGNYVIQNFLQHGSNEQRVLVCASLRGQMMRMSLQAHGCRVVQRALDVLSVETRNELVAELLSTTPKIIRCAKDAHATHVLQKATILLQEDKSKEIASKGRESGKLLEKIESAVADDVLILAVHPNACRLVQRVLGKCDVNSSTNIANILSIVVASYHALAIDQHGNFILQHILDNGNEKQAASVQAFVCSRVLELAQHKFGSHLVEKCLNSATTGQVEALVRELLDPKEHNEEYRNANCSKDEQGDGSTILMLMKDPYANFVVQRAFDASSGFLRKRLAEEIESRSQILNKFTYGRHILSHIKSST